MNPAQFLTLILAFLTAVSQVEAALCSSRILVAATGDIMVHDQPQLDAHASADRFFTLWKPVAPYIQAADIAYGNLESPVALGIDSKGKDHGDIGFVYDRKVYSGTNMVFNYHPQVLSDLREVGFDVLSTANNHTMDRLPIGIDRTLDELIRGRWSFTGTRYSNGRGEWESVTQVKGKSLFWLSCTQDLNGNQDPKKQVLNCYKDQKEIETLVKEAVIKYDAVFLLPHWGDEYSESPNNLQKDWAKKMASYGVTAIFGNHPHVLQPLQKIENTWVAYSLGNFSAWQKGTARKTSAILYLDLVENSDGRLSVEKIQALPIYRMGQIMYPYDNTVATDKRISKEALRYVGQHLGAERLVSGEEFGNTVLSCDP